MIVRAMVAGAALVVAAPAGAAVFIGTQVADTRLQGQVAGTPVDAAGGDAGVRAGTITASAYAAGQGVASGGGDVAVRGVSSVIASLTGTERGRITFRRTLTLDGDTGTASLGSAAQYLYFFSTDTPTAFELNWGVSAYGSMASQVAWLRDRSSGDDLLRLDGLGNGANGATSVLLGPGSYELRLQDASAPAVGAGGVAAAGLSSQYSFTMRAVPEPATWAMLLTGFGVVGGTLRRRRRRMSSSPA